MSLTKIPCVYISTQPDYKRSAYASSFTVHDSVKDIYDMCKEEFKLIIEEYYADEDQTTSLFDYDSYCDYWYCDTYMNNDPVHCSYCLEGVWHNIDLKTMFNEVSKEIYETQARK